MKKLCVYPWMHIHLHPSGRVLPCCMMDVFKVNKNEFGDLNDPNNSMLDVMNSTGMKDLRQKMLNNVEPDLCQICFDRERAGLHNMRESMNDKYLSKYTEDIANTNQDGSINEFNPSYVDLRFSNICNLKCRTCGLDLSSSWFEETVEMEKMNNPSFDSSQLQKFVRADQFEKIEPFLKTVDSMYWAGGEPLMEKNHYRVLDYMIEIDHAKHINLSYNTNMTTMTFKRQHIFEWWKHFQNITIAASIDGMGDVFEYIRTNGKWDVTQRNYEQVRFNKEYNNLSIYPSITVSLLNIYHIVEYLTWCVTNDWISSDMDVHINFVTYPSRYSIKNMPPEAKKDIEKKLIALAIKYKNTNYSNIANACQDIINFMNTARRDPRAWKNEMKSAINLLNAHDQSAGLNWQKTLPELADMLMSLNLEK